MSDFGKAVAEVFRDVKRGVESRTATTTPPGATPAANSIDPQVKEQVIGDLDKIIERHDPAPYQPMGGTHLATARAE